jgi:hypothetical protein
MNAQEDSAVTPSSPRVFNYELQSIILNAPRHSGIFSIFAWDACVYVGEAADISAGLLAVYDAVPSCSARRDLTHFTVELVASESRVERQEELIRELGPVCNLAAGPVDCRDGRFAGANGPGGSGRVSLPC